MRDQISPQAVAVLEVLSSERCHLTAEEIIHRMSATSTASVYRALDLLTARSQIRKLSLNSRSALYEYIREPHAHFVCSHCASVHDIPLDLSGLIREASLLNGCQVDHTEITAYGICSHCAAQKEVV